MKIGIIGCGGMGITHILALKALAQQMDLELVAFAERKQAHQKRVLKIWPQAKVYEQGKDLLESENLDAVHICVPSYMHTEYAIMAMKKNMAVLIEKPACLTESDCEKLLETEKQTGVSVMVGQVVRYMDEYKYLKEVYDTNKYGQLQSLTMNRISGVPIWGFDDWFFDTDKSGSVVMDLHIHDIDFMRYMLGEPKEIKAFGSKIRDGLINRIVSIGQYDNLTVAVEGLWDSIPELPFEASFRASFEEATLVFKSTETPSLTVYEKGKDKFHPKFIKDDIGNAKEAGINISELGPYYAEIKDFYECLTKGQKIKVAPLIEGIKSVKLALKEYQQCR